MDKKWNIFDEPFVSGGKKCFGILPVHMGQLIICNDGNGFYGYLNTNIKDNLSFCSTLCGNDIDVAKQEIIDKFKMHIAGIKQLCIEQLSQLDQKCTSNERNN